VDMPYDRETSRLRMTCRLEAGDWFYIPSGWWHLAQTQAESIHLSIGVMPVVRLKLFEFLQQYLAHSPIWCPRLPVMQPDEADRCQRRRTKTSGRRCAHSSMLPSPKSRCFMRLWPTWWRRNARSISNVRQPMGEQKGMSVVRIWADRQAALPAPPRSRANIEGY
jgi:hypothetical protein